MKDHILIITESKSNEAILKSKLPSASLIFLSSQKLTSENVAHLKFSFIIIDETGAKEAIFDFIKTIKGIDNTKAASILVITNKLNKSHLEKLIHSGVSNFIPTPIEEEDIFKTLKETGSHKTTDEIISMIKIPVVESSSKIDDKEVIQYRKVKDIREAFSNNKPVTLALIATNEKPSFAGGDLLMQITKSVYCIVSLDKNEKALYKQILEQKNGKFFAGIVSNSNKNYEDIAPMLEDAKIALKRAKETPHGISIYTK